MFMSAPESLNVFGLGRLLLLSILQFYHQIYQGCGDETCTKKPCLTYRARTSLQPFRRPSVLTARSWALTVASQPDAEKFLCETLWGRRSYAIDSTPERIDNNNLEQVVFSTRVMSDLFEKPLSNDRDDEWSEELTSERVTTLARGRQDLWPLGLPLNTARVWTKHLEETYPNTVRARYRLANAIIRPYGHEKPTPQYEAALIRAISMLRMQRAVQKADFHWDLVLSPPRFFMSENVGALRLNSQSEDLLGVTMRPSQIGLHSVTRRYVGILASRLAPLAMACDELQRVQKRQMLLPLRFRWTSLGDVGIDNGGVAQDFFQEVAAEVSQAPCHLFQESEEGSGLSWFNPAACDMDRLEVYEVFGAIMGLAIHNGFVLPVRLPLVFYELLHRRDPEEVEPTLSLLQEGWPQKFQALQNMLDSSIDGAGIPAVFETGLPAWPQPLNADEYQTDTAEAWSISIPVLQDVSELTRDDVGWTYRIMEQFLQSPMGNSSVDWEEDEVTDANKHVFVQAFVSWQLIHTTMHQLSQLRRGLIRILPNHLIDSVSAESLRLIVEGDPHISAAKLLPLIRDDPRRGQDDGLGRMFSEVVSRWPDERVAKLLQFVTASDRLPMGCNAEENPAFTLS
ncbi:MAG: hypothetical protein Q9162_004667, partial [Coniocarpon cinnabarinum]